MNNSYEPYDHDEDFDIEDLLNELEAAYKDIKADLRHANNQLKKAEETVKARDVLKIILPILSDLKNDVLDMDNVHDIRNAITVSYQYMKEKLSNIGVNLHYHERGDIIYPTDKVQGNRVPTRDKSKDGTCCRSVYMGCTIKGEERLESFEEVQKYVFDSSMMPPQPNSQTTQTTDYEPQYTHPNIVSSNWDEQTVSTEPQPVKNCEEQSIPTQPEPIVECWAEVNYDIYIKYTTESEEKVDYIARPGEFYPIHSVITLPPEAQSRTFWSADTDIKINSNINIISIKHDKKHIYFHWDEDPKPFYKVTCKKIKNDR